VSTYIPVKLRKRIRDRFKGYCAYCKTAESLTVAIFEVEHIVPQSAGGATVFHNLCLACPTCNRYKGSRRMVEDPVPKQMVALFHPQQQAWQEHFSWNGDGTEIVGRTPTGRATITALRMNRRQLIRVRRMWVVMGEHPPEEADI